MLADITGAVAHRDVHVEPLAVDVSEVELAAILRRPALAEVTHHAGMRMTAACGITARIARVRTACSSPVDMIAVLLDVLVDVGIHRLAAALAHALRLFRAHGEMLTALPLDARAVNHVPEVRDDAHLREELAVLVEIDAPRIAAALGEHFEDIARGMIPPHTSIHPLTFNRRCAGLAGIARAEDAVTTVEPAIRSPREGVQRLVRVGGVIPAIEQNLRVARRLRVVPIAHRHEDQIRRGTNPHPAEADFQTADQVHVLHEHRALVELVIPIRVFQHDNAISAAQDVLELLRRRRGGGRIRLRRIPFALGIRDAFRHPRASAMVEAESDRLAHIRFGGEDVHRETRRQRRLRGGIGRTQASECDRVRRRRHWRGGCHRGSEVKRSDDRRHEGNGVNLHGEIWNS